MKKRTFLLIEVLIALLLVSLCIVPLTKQPIQMYKTELEKLQSMEKERLADWTFSEIKEMFLKNEIPWKNIPDLGQTTGPFYLPDQKFFTLYGKGKKLSKEGAEIRQIYMTLHLGKDKYEYRLPIQWVPKKEIEVEKY